MRTLIPVFLLLAFSLAAAQAQAKSCSSFVVIESYDADAKSVAVKHTKGKPNKFFPKPEGAPADTTKIPGKCKKRERKDSYAVKPSGGRMSVTQVRSNFEGKMLNDTDSDEWFASKLKELVDGKTEVVLVIRPGMGKDAPLEATTIYLPANEEDFAEIKRLEDQAEDL
jgi:hypothetical protein